MAPIGGAGPVLALLALVPLKLRARLLSVYTQLGVVSLKFREIVRLY